MKAFLTLHHGDRPLGTLHLELYDQTVPKTVHNFIQLLPSYRHSTFHRIIAGFMAQGGDFEKGNGTGGKSIYGESFADENFVHKHDKPGMLSMANSGPNTNGSQFFVTFKATPHLDQRHVVFGHVVLEESREVLQRLERVRTGKNDVPVEKVVVVDCGVVKEDDKQAAVVGAEMNQDEIELDDEEEEETPVEDPAEEEEEEEEVPKTKAQALKQRLRALKRKMNQARQLNQRAVQNEAEATSHEGSKKVAGRLAVAARKAKEEAHAAQNAAAYKTAAAAGLDGKALTEQAAESVYKASSRVEKEALREFSVRDYHNPEGQYRNFERNMKSVPRDSNASSSSTAIYNPLEQGGDPEKERQGAKRIAEELQRRIEKRQKRENERKDRQERNTEGDVSYINQRNKHFNQKINRTYDKATAEIRQNLERGTAL